MDDLRPFRLTECGEGGCSCGGACGGDGAGKKRGRKARLRKLAEAWGVTPRATGSSARPKRMRGSGTTLPKLAPAAPARATANYGGDNSVSRPPTPPTPAPAKMARQSVQRPRMKRPQMGGALSAQGKRKAALGEALEPFGVLEYNPYHGPGGKFASKGNAIQTVVYGGRTARGKGANGQKAAAAKRHEQRAGQGSVRIAQDNREHGGIGGDRGKASARQPEHREPVAQNPKKFTKRMSSGKGPKYGVRVTPETRGSRLEQDNAASIRSGSLRSNQARLAARSYRDARAAKMSGNNEKAAAYKRWGQNLTLDRAFDTGRVERVPPRKTYAPKGTDSGRVPGKPAMQVEAARRRNAAERGESPRLMQDDVTPGGPNAFRASLKAKGARARKGK